MRIIGGRLKRRSVRIPRDLGIRPTTDRTREAMFSLVEARIALDGALVLDLFAGSGALGLEAISRGARAVDFVEADRRVVRILRGNVERLEVETQATVIPADADRFLRSYAGESYDVIFADPPYGHEGVADLPDRALPHVTAGGLFVLEHDRRLGFDTSDQLVTSRSYGRSTVSLFSPA